MYPATVEGPVNQQGEIDVLVPLGRWCAYLFERPREPVMFEVAVGEEDAGVVKLRR